MKCLGSRVFLCKNTTSKQKHNFMCQVVQFQVRVVCTRCWAVHFFVQRCVFRVLSYLCCNRSCDFAQKHDFLNIAGNHEISLKTHNCSRLYNLGWECISSGVCGHQKSGTSRSDTLLDPRSDFNCSEHVSHLPKKIEDASSAAPYLRISRSLKF